MKKGFTLWELLLVIVILGTLVLLVVFIVNPSERIKRSRDSRRISDLNVLKTAINLWITEGNTDIQGNKEGKCCVSVLGGVTCNTQRVCSSICCETNGYKCGNECQGNPLAVDGTGWIPINFNSLPQGSPFSNLPRDPKEGFRYCYAANGIKFELNAKMESDYYTSLDKDPIMKKDGGNNDYLYEVGTKLDIIECCTSEDCSFKGVGWTCSIDGHCVAP
jgi:prepilin-type N-terminal cleavage/methylation domain-containing protein